ncbi:MAG: DUF2231 domain-containing protein [Alphaproteobacteria bacterium]|nr:MAG: DUF2231 domain-containing protein [Alphaproteobacteria bacterium]
MIEIIPNWHPLLVHFTIALVTMAALFYLVARIRRPDDPHAEGVVAGRWALIAGALITLATIAAGFDAYNTVAHDEPAHLAMTDHRNWAVPTALAILLLAVWAWRDGRKGRAPSSLFVIILLIAAASLTVVGYKGAELVYRHGLGVLRLPQPEAGDHHHGAPGGAAHGHGTAHEHDHDHQPMKDQAASHDAASHDHDDEAGGDSPHGH